MNQIRRRREEILSEVAGLEFIRRGSVTEQVAHPRGRNGKQYTCGPYPLYSFKHKGRTLSRRLSAAESGRFRKEVEAGHRLQALMQELLELGEPVPGAVRRYQGYQGKESVRKGTIGRPAAL